MEELLSLFDTASSLLSARVVVDSEKVGDSATRWAIQQRRPLHLWRTPRFI